jgi:hypothetical protein
MPKSHRSPELTNETKNVEPSSSILDVFSHGLSPSDMTAVGVQTLAEVAGNAAASDAIQKLMSIREVGSQVHGWLSGIRIPNRDDLLKAAQRLPDDHGMLDALNDISERLGGDRLTISADLAKNANASKAPAQTTATNADEESSAPEGATSAIETVGGNDLSGAHWRAQATANGWANSTDFADLESSFGANAETFVSGLRNAGATVTVSAGLRHPKRAKLMHYAWKVAHGAITPAAATSACNAAGINIEWDHGELVASKAAAQALCDSFRLIACASLTSNHMSGEAIDMRITNVPETLTINGTEYQADMAAGGEADEDKVDHIGRELGVLWYGSGDWVHWSVTGR